MATEDRERVLCQLASTSNLDMGMHTCPCDIAEQPGHRCAKEILACINQAVESFFPRSHRVTLQVIFHDYASQLTLNQIKELGEAYSIEASTLGPPLLRAVYQRAPPAHRPLCQGTW